MVLADSFYYQPVQIDTIYTRVNADLFAKEGDANGRGMVVQITENGIIKDTTGITLRLQWSHITVGASGFTDFEVVDSTKGLYKVKYPTSMLHRGRVEAFIRITDNGILSGTRNLLITVERMVGSDETIEASDDFSALQTALTRLSILEEAIIGKVDTWESDMEATKQLYIDTLAAAEVAYPQELVALKGELAEIPAEINKGVATHTISNGGAYQRMAVAAITFDDGPSSDFTSLKPVMDSYGVKGTIFINNNTVLTGKLTDAQTKQLATEGWEFGSHTHNHTMLSYVALSNSINVGDTTIKILNPTYMGNYIQIAPSGTTKLRVRDSDIVFTVTALSNVADVLTLTLDKPSEYAVPTPHELYVHEDTVLEEVVGPKNYLNSLGIPCDGVAYPWGSTTNSAKRVVQSNFNYARSATNGVAGTNGGMSGLEENNLKQFELLSNELLVMTNADVDALIAKIVSEKGLLVFLGHSYGWAGLQPKLEMALTKLQAAGIPIMPLGEALKYHENTFNFADFNISKNGRIHGADFFLPFNSILGSHGLDYFPQGLSQVRITDGIAKGFPSDAGILTTVFSKGGAFWTYQEWREFDSFRTTNRIFHRTSTGWNSWTVWEELTNVVKKGVSLNYVSLGSQTIPANGKLDVIVPGVTVTNYSTPIVIAQAMHDSVRFTPFISGGKLYVRLENTSASPITWEQTLNVTVNETL